MAALFFTDRNLVNWFSHTPIHELTAPNTDDPKLLGLDAYRKLGGLKVRPNNAAAVRTTKEAKK